MKRPKYVTFIAWLFIIYALVSLLAKFILIVNPEINNMAKGIIKSLEENSILAIPFWFQMLYSYVGSVITLIAGVFLLRARNWARVTLIVWMVSALIITLLIVGFSFHLYSKSLFAIVFISLLYSNKSNRYFRGESN